MSKNLYKISDSLGGLVAEIHASSADDAWEAFIGEEIAFLPTDVRTGPHVERYSVLGPDGSATHRWLVLPQDEPECSSPEGDHDWGSPQAWGKGGGVTLRSRCARCGKCRVEDTWYELPTTGDVVPGTVTYYR